MTETPYICVSNIVATSCHVAIEKLKFGYDY